MKTPLIGLLWTPERKKACITGQNTKKVEGISSMSRCRQLCLEEASFTCLSAELHPPTRQCVLQEKNREKDAGVHWDADCGEWIYTERIL